MPIHCLKAIMRPVRQRARIFLTTTHILKKRSSQFAININNFDYFSIKPKISGLLELLGDSELPFMYRYSQSCSQPTLYASAYACMTKSMLGDLADLDDQQKADWVRYFDSFQEQRVGLFYDPVIQNEIYADTDWWGARHLALHMISAYTDLGARPRYPFKFLESYYDKDGMRRWLDQYEWASEAIGHGDPDNKIMNIGCLLQYQRDAWKDENAGLAVENLKTYLREKLNPDTGMWGGFSPDEKHQRSRMVQFAYHLLPIFFYDGDFDFDADRIVGIVLRTQNRFGGFGVQPNSSACEDIDSIDLLIRFHPFVSSGLQKQIEAALNKAFSWVLLNQAEDGGFIFRLNEKFVYGHHETSSLAGDGALFPTWFRTLSLLYLANFFGIDHNFRYNRCPGYLV